MTKKKRNVIWSNDINLKDWKGFISEEEEEQGRTFSDEEKYELIHELNNDYLDDERMNMEVLTKGTIIAIADLGLWSGRVQGYKTYGNNLASILYSDCETVEWFVDGKDVKFVGHHHDGTNYITYREVKNENHLDTIKELAYDGKLTEELMRKYTRSLKPYFRNIYGW